MEIIEGGYPTVDADGISERRVGPIMLTDLVRYAGAGGDFNPMHHDDGFARAAGYPGVFAMGLLTAGLLSGYVEDAIGRERLRRFSVRYTDQVWVGDVLVMAGQRCPSTAHGEDCFDLEVRRNRSDGAVVLTGRVVAAGVATAPRSGRN